MSKKSILFFLLDLVFLAVFNTIFFVAGGTDHPASVWISYGFIHFAYLMVIATPILTRKSSSAVVFGLSLYTISTVYFFVEFLVGLIFILIGSEAYEATLIIQVLIAAVYAVILIVYLIANESTADSLQRQEEEVAYLKNAASKVKLLMDKASDRKANREVEKVYDMLHSSPSRSTESAKAVERQISNAINLLADAVEADDAAEIISVAGEILAKIEDRNRKVTMEN